MKKIHHLSLSDAAWLSQTIDRNRARFGGWRMAEGDGDGSGDGGSGDSGGQGSGDTGGQSGSGDGSGSGSGDGGQSGKGFPENTPVAQMKPEEQTAYWKHQAQKHEGRNRDLLSITGGKYGDDLKADITELGKLRTAQLSDGEKAVETAKAEGRREASLALAPQMFDVALSHVDEERRKVLIDSIDLNKVVKEDGTIDTDKVTTLASTLAPADKDNGQRDYGQGRRNGQTKSGVSAGADMFAASRNKSTST